LVWTEKVEEFPITRTMLGHQAHLRISAVALSFLVSALAEDNVIALDASNFEAYIEKAPLVLVEFYAPWCGHCKQLAPEYEAAATILKDEQLPLAKVDAADDKNQKLAEKYDVQGFPTLKLFRNKKATDYMGERTATAIVNFMRKKGGPAVKYLERDSMANEFKDETPVAVIGFFPDKKSEAYKAFETAANDIDEIPFGYVEDNGIRKLLRAELNQIIVYKQFDEKRVVYEGDMQVAPITEFINANSMPLVVPFNEANAAKIFGGTIKVHLIVFADTDKDQEVLKGLEAPAKKHKGEVLVVTVSPAEEQITEYFGVTASDMPAVRLVDMREAGMKKFSYEHATIDEDNIDRFLEDFKVGRLKASLKTEDAPKEETGNVKVIVSKTFKEEVMEKDDVDVLVEFYAPWCGHCKELAPRYEALATKLKHVEKLVVAKVNAEANEIEGVFVEGFPTLRLYPATKKHDPVEFTGERTVEEIEAWLNKECTNKLEEPVAAADSAAPTKHDTEL